VRWCDRNRWKLGVNKRSKTSKFGGLNSLDFMELLGFQIHEKYKRVNNLWLAAEQAPAIS